ncbi:MAG: helix-turn-helix domain-containing protein [[Clostridium] innocuum]
MTLKAKRRELGLSQKELAELLSVDQTAISQWERGKTSPRLSKCIELAKILNCNLDELIINTIAMNEECVINEVTKKEDLK